MGFIAWIKDILGFGEDDFDDIEISIGSDNAESLMESLSNISRRRRTLNINDRVSRQQYIRECCDMMEIASRDVEAQKVEYQHVTERLADLDEIDSLPRTDRAQVRLKAKYLISIEDEEESYERPARKITEAQYHEMERLSDEIPGVIKKMKEDEEYQMKVRRDLNLLEGEKGALAYQRKEERAKSSRARTMAVVWVFVALMAAMFLTVIKKVLYMDVQLGYTIILAIFAIGITVSCVNFQNSQIAIATANKKINKAINLQNTVKIKYVNITNVLEYNYAKYNVMNSFELSYTWEKYIEERAAREHDSVAAARIEEARSDLYKLLKEHRIADPSVWVYQPGVLVHEEEEKEIRKALVVQRQRLKKGIDFEINNLESAKEEIQALVRDYPKYANEIIAIVEQYE